MWVILPSNADWDCSKTQILQEILRIQNLHQVEHFAFLEVILLFRYVGMCKKQTSVSHSSTKAEIISLRMGGIPAQDLWNWVMEVSHYNQDHTNKTKNSPAKRNLRTCIF